MTEAHNARKSKRSGWIVSPIDPMDRIRDLVDCALERRQDGSSIVLALVDELAERRGKEVKLMPSEMQGLDQFGCWLTDDEERFDFIFYEKRTARIHQEHSILHELGHIMLGHRTYRVSSHSFSKDMAFALMRTTKRDSVEEQEAEQLATLIQEVILDKVGLDEMLRQAGDTGWSDLFGGMRLDR